MDENELLHCIDFLDIALEELEAGNAEVAKEFVEDVNATLHEEYEE